MRNKFWVFTSQVLVIEDFAGLTGDETRLSFHACDETVTITGHGEPRERPELRGCCVSWYFSGTFEADDR